VGPELVTADVVHIAAHGTYDVDHPEASGIILGLPDATRADGLARYWPHRGTAASDSHESAVGEILSLEHIWREIDMFRCRLLNLSACSSAMVEWSGRSDQYYGLPNGFLYAGAQNIVTNVWPVNDRVSPVFNEGYYKAFIQEGVTEIAALKLAVQGVRDYGIRMEKPFTHPLFWAGYRIIGFL
jgi:CHAT domain-containing protein